jgi:hypothetical protein
LGAWQITWCYSPPIPRWRGGAEGVDVRGALNDGRCDWFAHVVQHGLDLTACAGPPIDARRHQQRRRLSILPDLPGLAQQRQGAAVAFRSRADGDTGIRIRIRSARPSAASVAAPRLGGSFRAFRIVRGEGI